MKKGIGILAALCFLSAPAMAEEGFTFNPMAGFAHNKAFSSHAAVGMELGYNNFLFGYTFNGDKEKNSFRDSMQIEDEIDWITQEANAYADEKYQAHQLYVGYKFDVGSGKLALKAGAELSKIKLKTGMSAIELMPGGSAEIGSFDMNLSSKNIVKPMIGVGYHMDNGLNFNLHYTFHKGSRNVKGNVNYDIEGIGRGTEPVTTKVSDKDLGTIMFTIGYRI